MVAVFFSVSLKEFAVRIERMVGGRVAGVVGNVCCGYARVLELLINDLLHRFVIERPERIVFLPGGRSKVDLKMSRVAAVVLRQVLYGALGAIRFKTMAAKV